MVMSQNEFSNNLNLVNEERFKRIKRNWLLNRVCGSVQVQMDYSIRSVGTVEISNIYRVNRVYR